MFRIPAFNQMPEMTFQEAVEIITRHGRGDLLEGMEAMDRVWEEHCAAQRAADDFEYCSDSDFYDNWCWEVNAFNLVFENMSKLFAPKAA